MQFSERRNITRWIIILVCFSIISLILWNTYTFFMVFKEDERLKMELWTEAQIALNRADENTDIDLIVAITSTNTTIPIIVTNEKDSILDAINLDENIEQDLKKLYKKLEQLKRENDPIIFEYVPEQFQYLYYGNSSLINKLKYYPIALLLIIFLFILLVYNYYRTSKFATQNKLWAGMAKETAHQIGTPLSSLIGWLEIMKADMVDPIMVAEIEKDILRLQTITDRFSKIGSEPALEKKDLIKETQITFDYLKLRSSKQVVFEFSAPDYPVFTWLNPVLHSWTIENLVKNAIDAMKGKGMINVLIIDEDSHVKIFVTDTGKGIPKKEFKSIFEPGFTTKKRGWGLGLSLTKRIVEDYHKGKIRVHHSEIGKGTTIVISFKKEHNSNS